jgi:anaerobic ribonucleoside-triphosphate reductase activating protein
LDIDDLARQLIDVPVEGVTFLGGEPFDQAPGLAELGSVAQESGLSVMTFTGYRYETLRDGGGAGWQQLLTVTDLLVDGPYVRHRPDTVRPWVGSTNQRFIHLTDRYLDHPFEAEEDRMEIRIRPDGTVAINGWPEAGLLVGLEDLVAEDW